MSSVLFVLLVLLCFFILGSIISFSIWFNPFFKSTSFIIDLRSGTLRDIRLTSASLAETIREDSLTGIILHLLYFAFPLTWLLVIIISMFEVVYDYVGSIRVPLATPDQIKEVLGAVQERRIKNKIKITDKKKMSGMLSEVKQKN